MVAASQTKIPASLSSVPSTPTAITACTTGPRVLNSAEARGTTNRIATTQTAMPRTRATTPNGLRMVWTEATAFRALAMQSHGEGKERAIAFSLDSGDAVILEREHPLSLVETETGPSPRILVRHGLEAELSRAIYYELAEIALDEGHDPPGVWSNGVFFPLDMR